MHTQLHDGMSKDLEVYNDINMYLKVRIKDRVLPLNLNFFYNDSYGYKDLTVYYSQEHKDPREGGINSANCYNVSKEILILLYFSQPKYPFRT